MINRSFSSENSPNIKETSNKKIEITEIGNMTARLGQPQHLYLAEANKNQGNKNNCIIRQEATIKTKRRFS